MTAQMIGQLVTIIFLSFVGFAFVVHAFNSERSKSIPDEDIKKFFLFGLIFVVISIIGFSVLFHKIGSAGKKEIKKEQVFVVQKKLNNHKAEILGMEEGDIFIIEEDKLLLPKPEQEERPSLSDIKKM